MAKDREHKYVDNVLIRLKRKYSKDDTVAMLIQKLSDTEILLGQRNDEIEELKEIMEFSKMENEIKQLRGQNKTFKLNIERMKERSNYQKGLLHKYQNYTGFDKDQITFLYDRKQQIEVNSNFKKFKNV